MEKKSHSFWFYLGLLIILPFLPFYFIWKSEKTKKNMKLIYTGGILLFYLFIMAMNSSPKVELSVETLELEAGGIFNAAIYIMPEQRNNEEIEIISNVNPNVVGEYTVIYKLDDSETKLVVTVKDTTRPKITSKDIKVNINTVLSPEELIISCEDISDVTYVFLTEPVWNKVGEYDAKVEVKDTSGNVTVANVKVTIQDYAAELVYMSKMGEWLLVYGGNLGTFSRLLQNNDLGSSKWNRDVKNETIKITQDCVRLDAIKPTTTFKLAHSYMEKACEYFEIGFVDFNKGIDRLDEDLIISGVDLIETALMYSDLATSEIDIASASFDDN
jgi:hypothetical protein